jgi:hypothetical protein
MELNPMISLGLNCKISSASALAFGKVNPQLLEFAIQMSAL